MKLGISVMKLLKVLGFKRDVLREMDVYIFDS